MGHFVHPLRLSQEFKVLHHAFISALVEVKSFDQYSELLRAALKKTEKKQIILRLQGGH